MNGKPWTPSQLEKLRRLYPGASWEEVGVIVGRSLRSVYAKAKELGLRKSDEYLASERSGRIQRGKQHPSMIASQFKPGTIPWNKGTHFVAGGRSAETRFKVGRKPEESRNYLPIGSLRLSKDGYLERKVTDDPSLVPARRWVAVHRLVWQEAHGDIPPGHAIAFKEGRRTAVLEEITVDRLECIHRAELARRNHPRSKSPELAKLVQLKGAITRQVNRLVKESQS